MTYAGLIPRNARPGVLHRHPCLGCALRRTDGDENESSSPKLRAGLHDETGLTGNFDFKFNYEQDDTGSGLLTAIKKLGLKLESRKARVEHLVVDQAENRKAVPLQAHRARKPPSPQSHRRLAPRRKTLSTTPDGTSTHPYSRPPLATPDREPGPRRPQNWPRLAPNPRHEESNQEPSRADPAALPQAQSDSHECRKQSRSAS